MSKHRLGPSMMALFLFCLTLTQTETLCQKFLQKYAFKPGVVETSGASQSPLAFQGIFLQQEALNRSDILTVYGSSEFAAESPFHPWPLLDGKPTGFVTYLIGRGGSQSLPHTLSLAAQGDNLQGKKLAVVISLQWFNPEGINKQYFQQNYSPLQTYRILYSRELSPELKKRLLTRIMDFPEVMEPYPRLQRAVQLYFAPKLVGDFCSMETWPEKLRNVEEEKERLVIWLTGYLDMQVQTAYEVLDILEFIPQLNSDTISRNSLSLIKEKDHNPIGYKTLDWNKLRDEAHKQGQKETASNTFRIKDDYYAKYIRSDLQKKRWAYAGATLYPSKEYDDLKILMDTLKEKNAEPLFLIIPAHGQWYDYTGYPQKERQAFYKRITALAKEQNFKAADFSGHEYTPYFLEDIMHLGWKGWVYVNEELDKFYHQGN